MLLPGSSLPRRLADSIGPLGGALPGTPRRHRRWRFVAAVLALLAAAITIDMLRFSVRCHRQALHSVTVASELPQPVTTGEAIVVLTGDHGRIAHALELLRQRGSPLLVISGTKRGVTLTNLVNQQGDSAVNIHEIWKKIIIESHSSSTIENAVESGRIFRNHNVDRVILATSDYHMERALLIFEAIAPGPTYIAFPIASEVADIAFPPSSRTLTGLSKIWVEYWKALLYTEYQSHFIGALRP